MVKPEARDGLGGGLDVVADARPAGAFIAKYRPGSMMQAAIIAMTATNDSISMAP